MAIALTLQLLYQWGNYVTCWHQSKCSRWRTRGNLFHVCVPGKRSSSRCTRLMWCCSRASSCSTLRRSEICSRWSCLSTRIQTHGSLVEVCSFEKSPSFLFSYCIEWLVFIFVCDILCFSSPRHQWAWQGAGAGAGSVHHFCETSLWGVLFTSKSCAGLTSAL